MKSKVKFEDVKTMLFSFVDSSRNWLFSFDIKSGYHHIDIFPPDQEFLGFSWFKDGFTLFDKFTVLPYGLSIGPFIFLKVMRPLVRYWPLQAFRIAVYLDDGLGVCPSFVDCFSKSLAVKSNLFRVGFVANTQKSIWAPVQSLRGLGYCWDLKDNLLTVPEDKIDKLLVSIANALSQSSLPARQPILYKNWDSLQIKQSSTWREFHCVSFALKSFAHLLSGCFVKWFTDSQAVSLIVDSGSMKEHLHQLAVDIFHTAKENNIEIEVEWIPRSLNEKADYLSKIIDFDDWTVKDCFFFSSCGQLLLGSLFSKSFR